MVWPVLAGLFGSLLGGGAAAGGASALAGVGAGAATAGGGAAGALSGLGGNMGGLMSALGSTGATAAPAAGGGIMDMAGNGVSSILQGGQGGGSPVGGADPTRWDKFLSSVEGDMEKPMSQGQRGQLQQHMQGGGIMDASRPQYGMEDFRSMFSGTEQGERERIINTGLMSPYVEQLLGGKYV